MNFVQPMNNLTKIKDVRKLNVQLLQPANELNQQILQLINETSNIQ